MEIVASVAGVAGVVGILGLVGQAVHGVLKLKEFMHGVSAASETVKSFLEAIDSLETTLTAISDLIEYVPEEWLVGTETQNTNRLALQIEKCRADIDEWVEEMPVHRASSSKGMKPLFKKILIASDDDVYSKFHQKVARHLQGMQMSLDVLGWADVIAGNVKDISDAQTSFNHEVIQNFDESNDNFAARLSPVSSQLDRLEHSSHMSSASISSLASDVSRVLKLLSSNPALAVSAKADDEDGRLEADIARASSAGSAIVKAKFDPLDLLQRPPRTEIEWCCDFLPGIEAAFSASGLICLYCGDEFDQASTDWSFKGRHLVDEHRYGECNLLLSYDSEEEFTKHIREFHQCSLGYNGRLSNEFLNEHRQCGREWGFHRGPESKDQNLTNDFHNISSRRWKALSDNSKGLKALHGNSGGAKVVLPLESANKIRLEQQPWELDLFIALSEEGCIVDGLMVASIFRPWSFLNHSGDDITRSCYSLGDGIKVSGCELVDRCHSCSKTPKVLPAYDTNKHTGLDGAGLLPKSSPTAVLPKGPLDSYKIMKERNPINSWLHQILNDSSTTRIIMFHTMKKHGVNFSNMYTWLGRVLDFWDLDEAARKVHEPDNSSDGAVDSRGSPEIRGRSHNSRCNS